MIETIILCDRFINDFKGSIFLPKEIICRIILKNKKKKISILELPEKFETTNLIYLVMLLESHINYNLLE
jgi:hypothetical protein